MKKIRIVSEVIVLFFVILILWWTIRYKSSWEGIIGSCRSNADCPANTYCSSALTEEGMAYGCHGKNDIN